MQKITLLLTISFLALTSVRAQEKSYDLTVQISGMKTDNGNVFLALYNSKETFLKSNKDIKSTKVVVKNGKAIAHFNDLTEGDYAISLFHDENDNQKMDTKIFGIPKEPYGFSNNAKGFMGPPKFDDAKFNIDNNKTISIQIN